MTRFLIVDDDESSLYILQTLLETIGYDVVSAQNGVEALEIARRNPPDIIVSDILMPEMDGFTLCREWRADQVLRAIPFVFYTATYTSHDNEKFALGLGAERFIVKTIDPEMFIDILQEVLAQQGVEYPDKTVTKAEDYLKGYSATLIRKLEAKVEQLEATTQDMEREIARRMQAEKQNTLEGEQAMKLRRFVKDVSRDLQTSLTLIQASLHSLREFVDSENGQQHLETLGEQIAHLEKLSNDIIRIVETYAG